MQEVKNGNKEAGRAAASIETVVDGIRTVALSAKDVSIVSKSQAVTLDSLFAKFKLPESN